MVQRRPAGRGRSSASRSRRAAEERARGEVERPARLRVAPGDAPRRSRCSAGSAAEVDDAAAAEAGPGSRSPGPAGRRTTAKVVRSASWRRTISARRAPAPRASSGPARRSGAGDVVGGAAGLELVEEPEPLLGEGERAAAPSRGTGTSGAACAGLSRLRRASTICGQRRPRSAPRRARAAGSSTPSASRTRATTWVASERVAAELEEVVVDADSRRGPAPRAQIVGHEPPRSACAGRPATPPRAAASSGAGSAARSTLPLGVQRAARPAARRPRAPCSRAGAR